LQSRNSLKSKQGPGVLSCLSLGAREPLLDLEDLAIE